MAKQTVQPQKRRGPAPTGKGTPIQVRMLPDLLSAVDAYRQDQATLRTRPEAVRALISDALTGAGYLPAEPEE
jgi:hypothetical protein